MDQKMTVRSERPMISSAMRITSALPSIVQLAGVLVLGVVEKGA